MLQVCPRPTPQISSRCAHRSSSPLFFYMNLCALQGLTHSLCMPVVVDEESRFEMTLFVLPKGGEIPLHDHPDSELCFLLALATFA